MRTQGLSAACPAWRIRPLPKGAARHVLSYAAVLSVVAKPRRRRGTASRVEDSSQLAGRENLVFATILIVRIIHSCGFHDLLFATQILTNFQWIRAAVCDC